jgi:hypothetical protein
MQRQHPSPGSSCPHQPPSFSNNPTAATTAQLQTAAPNPECHLDACQLLYHTATLISLANKLMAIHPKRRNWGSWRSSHSGAGSQMTLATSDPRTPRIQHSRSLQELHQTPNTKHSFLLSFHLSTSPSVPLSISSSTHRSLIRASPLSYSPHLLLCFLVAIICPPRNSSEDR